MADFETVVTNLKIELDTLAYPKDQQVSLSGM